MRNSYLDRYAAGEREAVWEELHALGPLDATDPRRPDVVAVVDETMRRVRENVDRLVRQLRRTGYLFEAPEPYLKPDSYDKALVKRLEQLCGGVPLTLGACLKRVGHVCLQGRYPDWPEEGFYTDALWLALGFPTEPEEEYRRWLEIVAEYGAEDAGPFGLTFAPSFITKVKESGGGGSLAILGDASVDATLHFEEAYLDPAWVDRVAKRVRLNNQWRVDLEVYLVDYLRECFKWGGFPGVARAKDRRYQQQVRRLAESLLPV
jgi:hypothetical protein